jgi:hypothetical protein
MLMTYKLQPWQQKILVDIESGGLKPGEMAIMMSGRNIGKSTLTSAVFKRMWDDINKPRPITDLILGESPVHGSRYYTVQPEGGSWAEMEEWCKQTYGEPGDMWESSDWCWPESARWLQNNRKFWFRKEADRDWFIMRWRS